VIAIGDEIPRRTRAWGRECKTNLSLQCKQWTTLTTAVLVGPVVAFWKKISTRACYPK